MFSFNIVILAVICAKYSGSILANYISCQSNATNEMSCSKRIDKYFKKNI